MNQADFNERLIYPACRGIPDDPILTECLHLFYMEFHSELLACKGCQVHGRARCLACPKEGGDISNAAELRPDEWKVLFSYFVECQGYILKRVGFKNNPRYVQRYDIIHKYKILGDEKVLDYHNLYDPWQNIVHGPTGELDESCERSSSSDADGEDETYNETEDEMPVETSDDDMARETEVEILPGVP